MKILNKIKELFEINNQKGVVLPIILMAIGGLSLIGAAAIGVSTGEIGIANNDRSYKSAINLAEAGISDAADGIQANRDLLPRPLGAVNSASYSFNVGLNNTGRYVVTVSLPVVATISGGVAQNASSVVVDNAAGLNAGDTVVIGDTSTHIMTKIGSISGTTLNLVDNKGNAYSFGQALASGWVAKNKLQITSIGQAGTGLVGQYTVGGWRTVNIANTTPTLSTAGVIRSAVTLQGEYTMQEIAIFNSFSANVTQPGNKFNGPIFVTGNIDVSPYKRGDYSGPIFALATGITNGSVKINNSAYNPAVNPNPDYPKVIGVPATAATKASLAAAFAQAAASATCYQVQCADPKTKATQQIYYLNGYDILVKGTVATDAGITGFPATIGTDVMLIGGNLYIPVTITQTFTASSSDNMTININSTANAGTLSSSDNIKIQNMSVTPATESSKFTLNNSGQVDIKNGTTYYAGTTIMLAVKSTDITSTGTYIRLYDNSNNPGVPPGGTKAWSNGVWVTPLGVFTGKETQGDTSVNTTHTNHETILTTKPVITVTGPSQDGHAALFGGKKMTGTWTKGEQTEYYTLYYIHTTAVGNCNPQDIVVVSKTAVTYLGDAKKCTNSSEIRRLFLFETIWNHTVTNTANVGYQADSAIQPQKGYYKWVKGKQKSENEAITANLLIGDKEFNSVFNHAAKPEYNSSIVNLNIGGGDDKGSINMVGWSNPPLRYDGNASKSMSIYTKDIGLGTTFTLPTNPPDWDLPDMVGPYTDFVTTSKPYGLDFTDFSIASGSIVPYITTAGNEVLPDVSTIPNSIAGGSIPTYKNNTQGVYPGSWGSDSSVAAPNATSGSPIMDPNGLQPTTITATISGPYFSWFTIKRGSASLFFDPANGIAFNVAGMKVETKGAGANITIGSSANPATVFAKTITLESEDCGGTINFNFTGKMVANKVEFEKNIKYNMDTTLSGANTCLSPALQSFIYLKKDTWKEIR